MIRAWLRKLFRQQGNQMAGDIVFNDATVTINVEAVNIYGNPSEVLDRLGQIAGSLNTVREEISTMTPELQRLTTEVEETRTAQAGLITLVNGLAQQIRDNVNDPAALTALADSLDAGQTEIAAAVTANTTPPTP